MLSLLLTRSEHSNPHLPSRAGRPGLFISLPKEKSCNGGSLFSTAFGAKATWFGIKTGVVCVSQASPPISTLPFQAVPGSHRNWERLPREIRHRKGAGIPHMHTDPFGHGFRSRNVLAISHHLDQKLQSPAGLSQVHPSSTMQKNQGRALACLL